VSEACFNERSAKKVARRTNFRELKWDAQVQMLTGFLVQEGSQLSLQIPRDLIHTITMYNDATESEIEKFKEDIAARLLPHILSPRTS